VLCGLWPTRGLAVFTIIIHGLVVSILPQSCVAAKHSCPGLLTQEPPSVLSCVSLAPTTWTRAVAIQSFYSQINILLLRMTFHIEDPIFWTVKLQVSHSLYLGSL
jgi:hypothetical protein